MGLAHLFDAVQPCGPAGHNWNAILMIPREAHNRVGPGSYALEVCCFKSEGRRQNIRFHVEDPFSLLKGMGEGTRPQP